MRIAIVGAGGVGGLLAGLLARAGEEVGLVARGAQLTAIKEHGIRISSSLGSFTQPIPRISADPGALAPVDLVIVAVKSWQVSETASTLGPLLANGGLVVPLQNGVEASDRLSAVLGPDRVAGGVINVLSWIDGPGVIKHVGDAPRIQVGLRGYERPSGSLALLSQFVDALVRSGCQAHIVDDVEKALWEKLLLVEPWGAIGAATRAPIGAIRTVPESRALHRSAMEEVVALAQARGVDISPEELDLVTILLDSLPPDATVSMQRDIGAGKPSEMEDQTGAVVRLAAEASVASPVHTTLFSVLAPQEAMARGRVARFARS